MKRMRCPEKQKDVIVDNDAIVCFEEKDERCKNCQLDKSPFSPAKGALYVDTTKNRYKQYCPVHGWIDVTDNYGNCNSEMFKEHLKCGDEVDKEEKKSG